MLTALWTAMRSRVAGWLAVLATAAAVLAAAYSRGRQDAAAHQDRARLETIKKARHVEDEVSRLGPADVDEHLARWMRDNKR